MTPSLIADVARRPDLFIWNGAIPHDRLAAWLRERGWRVPPELERLWEETGGGEMFESEQILGPFGSALHGDDVEGVNRLAWERGLAPDYLVFHVGVDCSAVQQSNLRIVALKRSDFSVAATYPSLDSWYVDHVRREFAARYGLPLRAG